MICLCCRDINCIECAPKADSMEISEGGRGGVAARSWAFDRKERRLPPMLQVSYNKRQKSRPEKSAAEKEKGIHLVHGPDGIS